MNTPKLQYNSFHTELGNLADVIMHKPYYFAYSDTGIFANFIFGNEVFNRNMSLMAQNHMSTYAQQVLFLLFRSINLKFLEQEINIGLIY